MGENNNFLTVLIDVSIVVVPFLDGLLRLDELADVNCASVGELLQVVGKILQVIAKIRGVSNLLNEARFDLIDFGLFRLLLCIFHGLRSALFGKRGNVVLHGN